MGDTRLANHEQGHDLGNEHSGGASLMNPKSYSSKALTDEQKKSTFMGLAVWQDGTWKISSGNAQKAARTFLTSHSIDYNEEKAKKAGAQ